MKRMLICLLTLTLLLAGCRQETVVLETTPPSGPVVAASVDEMLAAIETGAQIILEPGTYDLTTASDYGTETGSPWYQWVHAGDGYELTLTGVQDITIWGSGKSTTQLVTGPRHANVLTLDSCRNVVLEGFTAGHTDGGECAGGVVFTRDCENVQMHGLGLFGCGTIGFRADGCSGVTMEACEIYECSYSGIYASITEGLKVKNCTFHDLGDPQWGEGQVFYLNRCKDTAITGCEVTDNNVVWLVAAAPGAGLELRDTVFARNRVESAVFAPEGSGLVLDGCTFEENTIHRWFEEADMTVLDGNGKTWTEESLSIWYTPASQEALAGDRTEVKVSSVEELMAAIAPNTEIVLADGTYDLSTAKGYGVDSTDYYFWSEEFDGPSLVLTGVSNFVIRSESGDVTKCILSAVPRYANVLTFRHCSNIALQGITAGHTVEPGYCMGGVLDFEGCDTVQVENCGLYGCGILGIQADVCRDLTVTHCDIYECSYGGIRMYDVDGVTIENSLFRDLGGDSMYFEGCANVTVNGEKVAGNARIG